MRPPYIIETTDVGNMNWRLREAAQNDYHPIGPIQVTRFYAGSESFAYVATVVDVRKPTREREGLGE